MPRASAIGRRAQIADRILAPLTLERGDVRVKPVGGETGIDDDFARRHLAMLRKPA